jgi:polyisoprenoid-binding protein YceI/cytochrome b561
MPAPGRRYSGPAVLLHWLIAALIVLQVVLAGRMEGRPTPERFAVFQLHKSVGITILLLSLLRLGWRLLNPPPPLPATLAPWERRLARWTHVGFYVVMIGMPLTGWIMVSASRIVVPTLLYGVVPWPMIPGLPHLAPAAKKAWHAAGELGHGGIIKVAYLLLALHVAGALKHQIFSGDEPVLGRMAPGAIAGRWREPRLLLIALGFVAVIAFGRLVQPPRPPPGALPPPAPAAAAPVRNAPTPGAPAPVAAAPVTQPRPAQPARVAPEAQTTAPTPASSATAGPAAVQPARWVVEPGSQLGFESSWSGQPVRGRFDRWRADIVFSPEALDRSSVTVTVDVGSVDTADQQRDSTLPSEDWFDAAHHPKAVFTARRFRKAGEGQYVAQGKLELRGVDRPLELPFRLTIAGEHAQAHGSATMDRTAFGVGQGEFAATDQIPARVKIDVDVKARLAH